MTALAIDMRKRTLQAQRGGRRKGKWPTALRDSRGLGGDDPKQTAVDT